MSPGSFGARLTENGRLLADGPPARMTAAAITESRASAVPILYAFALEAGQLRPPATGAEPFPAVDPVQQQVALLSSGINWTEVTLVGEGYIDAQCDRLLSALDQLERTKRGTLANLNALQSATVGIMGLAIAAQQAIGIVGVAFGLVASLIDNSTSVVLYQLPASSIRTIVKAQRDVLRQEENAPGGALSRVTNQGLASARLAEYIQYCVPVTIEANVGKVLNNSRAGEDEDKGRIVTGSTIPAVTSALAPVITDIPRDTITTKVQPSSSAPGSILSQEIQNRRTRLLNSIRSLSDPSKLQAISEILMIDISTMPSFLDSRARIIAEVSLFISRGDAALARQRMDRVSQLLAPILGQTF